MADFIAFSLFPLHYAGVWILASAFNYVGDGLTGNNLDIFIFPAKILIIVCGWGIILGALLWFTRK